MANHKIVIPSNINYRVKEINGVYQPQYKNKKGLKWKNFTFMYHDSRMDDDTECNKTFSTLEAANRYIDEHVKEKTETIHYRDGV